MTDYIVRLEQYDQKSTLHMTTRPDSHDWYQ